MDSQKKTEKGKKLTSEDERRWWSVGRLIDWTGEMNLKISGWIDRFRANRLNGWHFRRQQIIDGFIVDFYCHSAGVVVEVDGEIHQQQVEYDVERDRILNLQGIRLLRFKNKEVRQQLDRVLISIARVCSEET